MQDRRPQARPSTAQPPNVKQLVLDHEILESKKLAIVKPDASAASDSTGAPLSQIDFGDAADGPRTVAVTVGVGSLASKKPATRRRVKAAGVPALTNAGEDEDNASASKKGATSSKKGVAEDGDMEDVIEAHLRLGGTSIKSIEGLVPLSFLKPGITSTQKARTSVLNGVRG